MIGASRLLRRPPVRREPAPGVATLAVERTTFPPSALASDVPEYRKLYDYPGEAINDAHAALGRLPVRCGLVDAGIEGFLRPAEVLALYECAYFTAGPGLELGSAWGLSTTILCRALRDAGGGHRLTSVEIDPAFARLTKRRIALERLGRHAELVRGDAATVVGRLARRGRRFALAFVDHDHGLPATRAICGLLPDVIRAGGLALFHDFNDARNGTGPDDYGVYQGVAELLDGGGFDFLGVIGSIGIVRRKELA